MVGGVDARYAQADVPDSAEGVPTSWPRAERWSPMREAIGLLFLRSGYASPACPWWAGCRWPARGLERCPPPGRRASRRLQVHVAEKRRGPWVLAPLGAPVPLSDGLESSWPT